MHRVIRLQRRAPLMSHARLHAAWFPAGAFAAAAPGSKRKAELHESSMLQPHSSLYLANAELSRKGLQVEFDSADVMSAT
jgi:hypothetical protein